MAQETRGDGNHPLDQRDRDEARTKWTENVQKRTAEVERRRESAQEGDKIFFKKGEQFHIVSHTLLVFLVR